jgi:hypothetical protein
MEDFSILLRKTELIPASDRKKIAFLRVWCLVEIAAAAKKADMPRIMKCGSYRINSDGSVGFDSKLTLLMILVFLIDINKAEATVESDKNRILADIQSTLSIEGLNGIVRGVLAGARCIAEFAEVGSVVQCAACGDLRALQYMKANCSKSLHAVASGGYVTILEQLLQSNIDVNAKDNNGSTALIYASIGGHVNCIDMLIATRADVNTKDNDGRTALMGASVGGHVSCIDMLMSRGADVNAKTNDSTRTALLYAYVGGHTAVIEALRVHGAID